MAYFKHFLESEIGPVKFILLMLALVLDMKMSYDNPESLLYFFLRFSFKSRIRFEDKSDPPNAGGPICDIRIPQSKNKKLFEKIMIFKKLRMSNRIVAQFSPTDQHKDIIGNKSY